MRVLFLALFMVLATHVSAQETQGVAAESPAINKQAQGSADANEGNTWKSAIPVRIIEDPNQADHASERETKSDKHDAEDLDAQKRGADAAERGATAAERQVIPTYAQAAFAAIGMGLLIYTLILNREATLAAVKATNTAIEANQIMREERRSWVDFKIEPNGPLRIADTSVKLDIKVVLRNIGERPATGVKLRNIVGYMNWSYAFGDAVSQYVEQIVGKEKRHAPGGKIVIFPADPFETEMTIGGAWEKAPSPEHRLFFIFCVIYRGVGVENIYHHARIYEIAAGPTYSHGWHLLEISQSQSIS